MKRVLASILFFVLVIFSPWWIWFFVGVVFTVLFKNYLEFPIFVLLSDLTFGTNFQAFFNIPFLLSIISVVFYFILQIVKPNIRISSFD